MARRQLRIPMFFKFFVGCQVLASILILGGTWLVHSETRMQRRGNYLRKHFQRFLEYQEGLGRALTSVTDLLTHDPQLRATLGGPPAAPISPAAGGATGAGVTAGASDWDAARDILAGAFEVLQNDNSVKPDFMLVFDGVGNHVFSRIRGADSESFSQEELGQMKAAGWVRGGGQILDKILVHRGRAYQISGVPMRGFDGKSVIGGIIMGVALGRYYKDFMEQSDTKPRMQYRLSLLYKSQVVASVIPRDDHAALIKVLEEEPSYVEDRNTDGSRYYQRTVNLEGEPYDVYTVDTYNKDKDSYDAGVKTYDQLDEDVKGQIYLLRSRSNLAGRGPKIPWFEMGVGFALSLLIASLLALFITRPIKQFVVQSRQILEGETDLTQRIQVNSRDETQDLADNINQVFERLYSLANEVQGASFHVGASSAEISAASRQMLDGLEDQSVKIEGSTAAVTELSASIQQVAANAAEATHVAEKSNVAVTSAVHRMQEIRAAVEDAADKMRELNDSSKRIGNIVEVIRQISEQTSLLALNASIEAAHAGEQGRGFAVVADEVSSLARRVGQSAKDIESLIQTIKEQTTEAMSSMQIGTREVEQGAQLVTDTLTDLTNLIHVVKDTAGAVQEQAVVSDEIARNMDAVQGIASELLTGSKESVVQAEQLHELAYALEQSVGGFNLDSASASGHTPRARLPDRVPERMPDRLPERMDRKLPPL
jgi:methyl-accepting chemotaxis protein